MGSQLVLDGQSILLKSIDIKQVEGKMRISAEFNVISEKYHEITTLLYKGIFDIEIPEAEIAFRGKIIEYSTSVTNLYKSDQVGVFKVDFLEEKE
ncbi:DUF3219 family protein [Mesobacillus subterraneus]|uniref:DUF3219 family protein n=1 Tax=Mesobacillus subterraneus TaxID=285983 RepID=A0A3R9KTY3_9BACI|nr:DUF3219 family protein [Mesobacillus subterraneus]RSD26089.1 DUF3219 family protein [Mesobacillus subterraneus]